MSYGQTKPCKNPRCPRSVTLYSGVQFCGHCQLAITKWVERYPVLEHFSRTDLEFMYCHIEGCPLPEFMKYLGTKSYRVAKKIKTTPYEGLGGRTVRMVSLSDMAIALEKANNWLTLGRVAKRKNKDYGTLRNYAFSDQQFFGPVEKNIQNRNSIHISSVETFEKRWRLAEAYFRARKYSKGKPRPVKDALKPWIAHQRSLTKKELRKKYCCRGRTVSYELVGYTCTECYDRDDAVFIDLHPNGCHLDDLQEHLGTSEDLFNYSVRNGNILIDHVVREGKRVRRYISRDEMCRIISLMHNRIVLKQLARDYRKDYTVALRWAKRGYFGPLMRNFSGDYSVARCFAMGFLRCFELTQADRPPWQNAYIEENEMTSLALSILVGCNHSTTDRWFAKSILPGTRRNGMIIFSVPDIKQFFLRVAQAKHPVEVSLIEPCLAKSPFCEDKAFCNKFLREKEKTAARDGRPLLPKGRYSAEDIADASGVKPKTVKGWFRMYMSPKCINAVKTVSQAQVKQFVLGVMRRKLPVETYWAIKIVESSPLGENLCQDEQFVKAFRGLQQTRRK